MMMREILSREFALSKRCGFLKIGNINAVDLIFTSFLGHALYHHLTHKRNGNTSNTVYNLVGTGNICTIEKWSLFALVLWSMFTGMRHELLQTHGDVIGYPFAHGACLRCRCRSGLSIELVT